VPTDRLDTVTDVAAIAGLVAVATTTTADPTTVVVAVAGLGGYRMRERRADSGEQ